MSPISLTVHRNTKVQRRRKELRDEVRADAGRLSRDDIAGYVLVVFKEDGDCLAEWDLDDIPTPYGSLGDIVKAILDRKIAMVDAQTVVRDE